MSRRFVDMSVIRQRMDRKDDRVARELQARFHHIVAREDQAVRYDVRNGLCLGFATHFQVERHELRIVGSAFFVKGGRGYIDATYAVRFVRV